MTKKTLYHLLYSLFAMCLFISCEKNEIIFQGPYHVRFTDTLLTFKESWPEQIKVKVHIVGPQLEEKVTIKYSVQGTAREGVDYKFESNKGEVTISPGQSFGYIYLDLINNANNILESQNLIFTITQVTPSSLSIGRSTNGIIGKSFTLIIEDDCILNGSYKGLTTVNGLPDLTNIKISSLDCSNYTISNWDTYIISYFPPDRVLTFIDNGDNTLSIPRQKEDTFGEKDSVIFGSGSVDPVTKRIILNISHYDNDKKKWEEDQATFLPQ